MGPAERLRWRTYDAGEPRVSALEVEA